MAPASNEARLPAGAGDVIGSALRAGLSLSGLGSPDLDPETLSPPAPGETIPCDETNDDCDDDSEEFDGDDAAGLSAEPSLLEWAFDQYYAAKTFALAVASKLETPSYQVVRTEQVRTSGRNVADII